MSRGVTEAAEELVNFAWSAVVTDCTESADYLNQLVDNLRAALAAEPGAAEGGQAHDLIAGRAYESENFGTVTYRGLDRFHGEVTHEFSTPYGNRYIKSERLSEFLKPIAAAPRQSGESGNG